MRVNPVGFKARKSLAAGQAAIHQQMSHTIAYVCGVAGTRAGEDQKSDRK
jgi:hypothetical protein